LQTKYQQKDSALAGGGTETANVSGGLHGRERFIAAQERENAIRAANFSLRLRVLMKAHEATQKSLGHQIGVAQSAVFAWLNGTLPRGSELARLAKHFSVSLDWLVNGVKADRASGLQYESSALPTLHVARVRALAAIIRESSAEIERITEGSAPKSPPENSAKRVLTPISAGANLASVKSPLAQLLERLNRATVAKGRKAELAEYLKAPRPCVSDWLSGKREPSGETTLRLLQWVEQWEAQQKQNPGSVSAPPGPKTRVRKSGYEKQTQVRKKG
jgi:transcriptional regulator with XRE-family HTH domain